MDDPAARIFGLAPGVDFPAALVAGLRARMAGRPPEAMARVTLYLNTARMQRRVTDLMAASGAGFLPRIRLVTDLAHGPGLPEPMPPLRRRLLLARLIARLIEAQPDIAPRAALYELADSLAALIDEMQGEGVAPETVAALDVSDHSAHWKRTQDFLRIVSEFLAGAPGDSAARQRLGVTRQIAAWQATPPGDPVVLAGSTGSRGTTAMLMQAVAALPTGAVVLPGFDFDMPQPVWDALTDALTAEDHPQYRLYRVLQASGLRPGDVRPWHDTPPPDAGRNALVSLSLRPAPVTDQWLAEGQALPDLYAATARMTLIEAGSPRAEALAIALILRRAAEEGRRAALISPDRGLTRQVTAALDGWGILPDDSAGRPLALSAPGRFLRHVAALFGARIGAEALLILLKHPLTHSGAGRGEHLRHSHDLELTLRRSGPAFPDAAMLRHWAAAQGAAGWGDWLAGVLDGCDTVATRPLADHVSHHIALAERLAAGSMAEGSGTLWHEEAGTQALALMTEMTAEAGHGGTLSATDYGDLLTALLNGGEVRDAVQPHPEVMIWGTLEARVQGADLVILGGLNDGSWPQATTPDPWMNRQMRLHAGLLLPERQIGLAAHDYQQAVAAPEVMLTRARRDAEAETVPSRWLNRLVNLMQGLPARNGPDAVEAMRARGQVWLDLAARLDLPAAALPRAQRPAPRPPLAHRPRELPVTGIAQLIRDPYAVYARHILRLYPLSPLRQAPDARLRGSVLHRVMEIYALPPPELAGLPARARLMASARAVLAAEVPWPAARALWLARLDRAADWFLDFEAINAGRPLVVERKRGCALPQLGFTLTATPDRIDLLDDGRLHLLDYKTGSPPTPRQIAHFDKQLALEAAMATRGAFGPHVEVARATYIGLGATPRAQSVDVDDESLAETWAGLERLVAAYQQPDQGYTARRAVFQDQRRGDYDHLARHGEWDLSDTPSPETVGDHSSPRPE